MTSIADGLSTGGPMPTHKLVCLRCDGRMVEGFIPDRGSESIPDTQKWVAGSPERSFFSSLKLKGRDVLVVVTYRCSRCGWLESYAPARISDSASGQPDER